MARALSRMSLTSSTRWASASAWRAAAYLTSSVEASCPWRIAARCASCPFPLLFEFPAFDEVVVVVRDESAGPLAVLPWLRPTVEDGRDRQVRRFHQLNRRGCAFRDQSELGVGRLGVVQPTVGHALGVVGWFRVGFVKIFRGWGLGDFFRTCVHVPVVSGFLAFFANVQNGF